MQVDLHVHTNLSDGKINIENTMPTLYAEYDIIAFTDHENIFDPFLYSTNGSTKYLSGVEICCNHNGQNIEILGYNFDTKNKELVELVKKVRNLRISVIKEIMDENGFKTENLPENPFRINVPLPEYINSNDFWKKYNVKYKKQCHSIPALYVIDTIIQAHGIPVLAHPMESLIGLGEKDIEQFILSLAVGTVELITPKHSKKDISLINDIIVRNHLFASIGSDSHQASLRDVGHVYDLSEKQYEWILDMIK